MLIDYDLFDTVQTALVIGFFTIAAVAVAAAFWKKRLLFGAFGGLSFLLSIASIMVPEDLATAVFEVTGGRDPRVNHLQLIGTRTYVFANGRREELRASAEAHAVIINNTDTTLQIKPVVYSTGGVDGATEKTTTIAPFGAISTSLWVQYWGRGRHQPPSTIESRSYGETRYWLTWE